MSDAALSDPKVELEAKCEDDVACAKYKAKLSECTKRVLSKKKTHESCQEEYFEFMHCVDKCVAKSLFKSLK